MIYQSKCLFYKEHGDSSDEEGTAVIAKSKCSLLLLSKWYLNNYASLDNLNETDDRQITHLVIIIQDVGIFPRQVLNDFLKTIRLIQIAELS